MIKAPLIATMALVVSGCGFVQTAEPCYTESGLYITPKLCQGYQAIKIPEGSKGPTVAGDYEPNPAPQSGYTVHKVKDRHGLPLGTVEERPNGDVVIKDKWGIPVGSID